MKKVLLHIAVWLIGIFAYVVMYIHGQGSFIENIRVIWCLCLLFFGVYYINQVKLTKSINCNVNESGVLGGRGFGILVNLFLLNILLELNRKPVLNIFFVILSISVLCFFNKSIKDFWIENTWKKEFFYIYFAFNFLTSSILGLISCWDKESGFIEFDEIGVFTKILLISAYILVFIISEIPNSIIIKFASKNE